MRRSRSTRRTRRPRAADIENQFKTQLAAVNTRNTDKDRELTLRNTEITNLRKENEGLKHQLDDQEARGHDRPVAAAGRQDHRGVPGHQHRLHQPGEPRPHHAGLTFEVFDPATGVVKDKSGDLRGKATIEVISILDNTSQCRIVWARPYEGHAGGRPDRQRGV